MLHLWILASKNIHRPVLPTSDQIRKVLDLLAKLPLEQELLSATKHCWIYLKMGESAAQHMVKSDASIYCFYIQLLIPPSRTHLPLFRTLTPCMLPKSAGPCPVQKNLACPRLTLQLPQNQWLIILQYVSISLIVYDSLTPQRVPHLPHWCA